MDIKIETTLPKERPCLEKTDLKKLKYKRMAKSHHYKFIIIKVQYISVYLKQSLLGSLLITEELHSRIWDNSSTISTIPFEQPMKTISSPYIF